MEEGMIWTYGWVVFVKEEEQFQIGGSIEIYFGPPLLQCLDCLHCLHSSWPNHVLIAFVSAL